ESISSRFSRVDARFDIDLQDGIPKSEYPRIAQEIRKEWPARPGVRVVLMSAGEQGPASEEQDQRNFVLRLYGPDSEFLSGLALEVGAALAELPEVEMVDTRNLVGREEVQVAL